MFVVNKIDDVYCDNVANFDGFTACIIYSTANEKFARMMRKHWSALHHFSGESVLILAANLSEKSGHNTMNQFDHHDGTSIGYLAALPAGSESEMNKVNAELTKYFDIQRGCIPCIVFFDQLKPSKTVVYSFDVSTNWPTDIFSIFDDCKTVWGNGRVQGEDIATVRAMRMIELSQILGRKKFLRGVKSFDYNKLLTPLFGLLRAI